MSWKIKRQDRQIQRMFDNVTKSLLDQGNGLKRDPETGVLYEEHLKDEHPGLDLALMYAQPGNIVAKAFAPSMAKGLAEGIRNGNAQQAMLSMLVPESFKGTELLSDPKYFVESRIKLLNETKPAPDRPRIKWYGPTMGKTYAAKINNRLVDFDNITREAKNNLAKSLGFKTVRDMQMSKDPKVQQAYKDILLSKIDEFKGNSENIGKTLLVSNHNLVNEPIFDVAPMIPSRNEFVTRSIRRGDTAENAKNWYKSLIESNPNLKIEDRFVAEIEPYKQGGILKVL